MPGHGDGDGQVQGQQEQAEDDEVDRAEVDAEQGQQEHQGSECGEHLPVTSTGGGTGATELGTPYAVRVGCIAPAVVPVGVVLAVSAPAAVDRHPFGGTGE